MVDAAIFLRVILGGGLILAGGWFGFAFRNPQVVPPLALVFTLMFVLGKWYAWREALAGGNWRAMGRGLAMTAGVQFGLVTLLYLVGLGLGRLVENQPFAPGIEGLDLLVLAALVVGGGVLAVVIDRVEGGKGPVARILDVQMARAASPRTEAVEDGDFRVLPEPVTAATLPSPHRSSWDDHTHLALTKVTMHDGSRPLRKPRAANDLAIAAAEERLGVTLPEGLKRIYRVKDGGSTRGVMVPLVANPRPVFDDWDTAFGGYDDLHALDRLRTVHDAFLDFTDEDDAEAFPEGSKQLVVLAQWYLETTFLDYRAEGEPRVGMVDFENEDWTESARWFDDFDHFMAALRRVDMEHGRTPSPRVLRDEAPSPSQPDRFWGAEGPGVADHGADDARWTTASIRLGVALPEAFRPYLAAVNGGRPRFTVLPGRPGDWRQEEALDPFMGGPLLGVDQWVSLRLLSDRLVFTPGFPPWADTWQGADRLVVMAGSHDSVLMLDYRRGDDPEVLFVADLDDPSSGLDLGTPESFLAALRSFEGVPVIEDRRLSARAPAPETFWLDGEAPGLAAEALAAVEGRLGLSLPERLKTWMGRRNGGAVRFRYLPPVMETADGRLRIKTSETWEDIFPDGVAPAGDWVRLVDWMARRGEDPTPALRGLDHSQFVTAEMGEPSRVIVLAEGPERLTLLDMSRTTSAENGSLVQLRKGSQGWERIHRSGFFRGLSPRAARDTL